jgi:hypothetical protein
MGTFIGEHSVGEALHEEATVGSAKGFIHAVQGHQVSVRRPMTLSHQGVEEASSPCLAQNVPKGCLGGVKEMNPVAGDSPHEGSMDFDREEGKGLTHPVKDGQAAIGRTSKDAAKSKEFGRE